MRIVKSIDESVKARARLNHEGSACEEAVASNYDEPLGVMSWQASNGSGIAAYNDFVNNFGCFGDEYRVF